MTTARPSKRTKYDSPGRMLAYCSVPVPDACDRRLRSRGTRHTVVGEGVKRCARGQGSGLWEHPHVLSSWTCTVSLYWTAKKPVLSLRAHASLPFPQVGPPAEGRTKTAVDQAQHETLSKASAFTITKHNTVMRKPRHKKHHAHPTPSKAQRLRRGHAHPRKPTGTARSWQTLYPPSRTRTAAPSPAHRASCHSPPPPSSSHAAPRLTAQPASAGVGKSRLRQEKHEEPERIRRDRPLRCRRGLRHHQRQRQHQHYHQCSIGALVRQPTHLPTLAPFHLRSCDFAFLPSCHPPERPQHGLWHASLPLHTCFPA